MMALFLPLAAVTPAGLIITGLCVVMIVTLFFVFTSKPEPVAEVAQIQEAPAQQAAHAGYYLLRAGQPSGPHAVAAIQAMRAAGELEGAMMAEGGSASWQPVSAWDHVLQTSAVPVPGVGAVLAAPRKKTAGDGLAQAGLIIGTIGAFAALLGMVTLGPLGVMAGSGALGLGVVLCIIGYCMP